MVVLSGRLGWLQGGTRGVKLVEDDKEYGVGEDGEVENSGGGHGEQYGQRARTSSTLMSGFPMKGYGCA